MADIQYYSYNGILYLLDINKKIAYVYYNKDKLKDVTIPCSIIYNNDSNQNTFDKIFNQSKNKYIIDGIYPESFRLSPVISLQFAPKSELHFIGGKAFFKSSIERLSIPSSLKCLEDEWCAGTPQLTTITVSSENPNFKIMNDSQILIRKSSADTNDNVENDDFDTIAFVPRNIKNFTVPKFFKHIDSDAFEFCDKLQTLNFESDSQIQSIGKYCFAKTSIEIFTIPTKVEFIEQYTFYKCYRLRKVVFENDSKLKSIMQYAFYFSSIEKIILPTNLFEIRGFAFFHCRNLRAIHIPENSNLQIISDNAFSNTEIGSIAFPPCFRNLGNFVFSNCKKLQIVQLNKNMKHIPKGLFQNCTQEILIMVPVEKLKT